MSSDTLPTIVGGVCYGSLKVDLRGSVRKPRGYACEGDEPDAFVLGNNLYGKVMRGAKNKLVVGGTGCKRQSFEVNFQHTKTCIGEGFLALFAGTEALLVIAVEDPDTPHTTSVRITVPGGTILSACSRKETCCVMASTGGGDVDLLHYCIVAGELVATHKKSVVGLVPGSSCLRLWSSGLSDFLLLARVPVPGGDTHVARLYRVDGNDHILVPVACPEELAPTTLLTIGCSSRAHCVVLHYEDRVVVISMNGHVLCSIKDDQVTGLDGQGFDQIAVDMVTGSFAVSKGKQMVFMEMACAMQLCTTSLVALLSAEKEARQTDTALVSIAKNMAGQMARMDSPDRGFNAAQLSAQSFDGFCSFPVSTLDLLIAMANRNPHKQDNPIVVLRGSIIVGVALMSCITPSGMESYSVLEWNKGLVLLNQEERSYVLHHITAHVTEKRGRKLIITDLLPVDAATMYAGGADVSPDATKAAWTSASPIWMNWDEPHLAPQRAPIPRASFLLKEVATAYQLKAKNSHKGMKVRDFVRELYKVLSPQGVFEPLINNLLKCYFGESEDARIYDATGNETERKHFLSTPSKTLLKQLYCEMRRVMVDEQCNAVGASEAQFLPAWTNPPVVRIDDRLTLYHLWVMQRLHGVKFMIIRMVEGRGLVCVEAAERDPSWTPLFDELGVLDGSGRPQSEINDCAHMFLLEINDPLLHYRLLGYENNYRSFCGAFRTNIPSEASTQRHARNNNRCTN